MLVTGPLYETALAADSSWSFTIRPLQGLTLAVPPRQPLPLGTSRRIVLEVGNKGELGFSGGTGEITGRFPVPSELIVRPDPVSLCFPTFRLRLHSVAITGR